MKNNVNRPEHYTTHPSGVECLTITKDMDFCLGNAFKYLFRCGSKGSPLEDLQKAAFYLNFVLETRRKGWPRIADLLHSHYSVGLDAPHTVWCVVHAECRYSGHMAAALGNVWAAYACPRTMVFLKRALESIRKMESILESKHEKSNQYA